MSTEAEKRSNRILDLLILLIEFIKLITIICIKRKHERQHRVTEQFGHAVKMLRFMR